MQFTLICINVSLTLFQTIIYISVPNAECYMSRPFIISKQFYESILCILCIICGYIFLTMLYLYHDRSKGTFHSAKFLDYLTGVFFMHIFLLLDIFGNPLHWPVNADNFEDLFEEPIFKFARLHDIHVFYVNDVDRERLLYRYKDRYTRLHFYRESISTNPYKNDKAKTQLNIDQPTTTSNQALSIEDFTPHESIITPTESSTIPEKLNLVPSNTNQNFTSAACIHFQNNTTDCSECSKDLTTNQLRNESGSRSSVCTICQWTGLSEAYQDHLNQNYPDEFVTCSICAQQIERNKIHEHYLNETHQLVLAMFLRLIMIKNKQQKQLKFSQIYDAISVVSNDVTILNNNIQRINAELRAHETLLDVLIQERDSLDPLNEENEGCLRRMVAVQNISGQEVESLKQRVEDKQIISFDGTLMWKISDVEQKMNDAKYERQRYIYLPEFFTSCFGYKMCSRLFLNGINNACKTHLSIYFILMQGGYDALLKWPFAFKVSFTLLDQSALGDDQHCIRHFFWPDISSNCFQRPRLKMNEAYGIENFVSIKHFRQNLHRYAKNDTMYIKIEVDFTSLRPEASLDSGRMLLNDDKHTDTNDDDLMRKFLFMLESHDEIQDN